MEIGLRLGVTRIRLSVGVHRLVEVKVGVIQIAGAVHRLGVRGL